MIDLLKWVLGDPFRFIGFVILLAVLLDGLAAIARGFRPFTASGTAKNTNAAQDGAAERAK